MKNLNLIYALLLLSAFTSCKKDANKQISPNKPTVIAAVSDSISYTIDGKTYTAGGAAIGGLSSGSEDADRKLVYPDSTQKYVYSLVGNPDSIMYFQENRFISNSANINIYFVKKYIKHPSSFSFPGLNDVLKMFTVGKQPYAEDFGWQNSKNGIALDVAANNKGYTSYNGYNGYNTIVVPPGFQKNSTFEITSFTKASDGYNLEAKFTAVVIDNATGEQKQLDNGYLRLNFAPIYAN
jgi:hypothetical protein